MLFLSTRKKYFAVASNFNAQYKKSSQKNLFCEPFDPQNIATMTRDKTLHMQIWMYEKEIFCTICFTKYIL